MSRRCELTGIGPMVGHSVSHSNIKTKRRFLPSLKTVKVTSDALGQTFSLRISNAALRTLDYKGRARHVLEYRYPTQRIWGATASMLLNLRQRLEATR